MVSLSLSGIFSSRARWTALSKASTNGCAMASPLTAIAALPNRNATPRNYIEQRDSFLA
jgi:hypothetical protein